MPRSPAPLLLFGMALACNGEGSSSSAPAPAPTDPAAPSAQPTEPAPPATAKMDLVQAMRDDLAAPRSSADGAGTAVLVEGTPAVAGQPGRWKIAFTAGPEGIADGGALYFQTGPFWNWSTPQTVAPDRPGYTLVGTEAAGVRLVPETLDQGLLAIQVRDAPLPAGAVVHIDFGAGSRGALADRYAETASPFWVAVDGDGDGVRGLLPHPPTIDVAPGPVAGMVALLPSTGAVGTPMRLQISLLDRVGNAGVAVEGPLQVRVLEGAADIQAIADLGPADRGLRSVILTPTKAGVLRLGVRGPGELGARSNPSVIDGQGSPVLWADLHGHTGLSDGTGTPEDYFAYARDVARLDVVALTDHDHWGMRPLSAEDTWARIREATQAFHAPGQFVTVLGFEWTNWIHGHRHVLFFAEEGAICDSLDPACDHPDELWGSLRGQAALTFTHHQAGGPVGTNWDIPPDPVLEPIAEVSSVHGQSEHPDGPGFIYSPIPGNHLRGALDRGYKLGLVGSGDSHDGHPGLAHLASNTGGLAGILATENTRAAVLDALRARRVYGTNGPRIILRASVGGARMGSSLPVPSDGQSTVVGVALGTGALKHIDVIADGAIAGRTDCGQRTSCRAEVPLKGLRPGSYAYVRAVQVDGGAAWSSPFFFEATTGEGAPRP